MPEGNIPTFTTNPDGTVTVKDSEGKEVRYAKESDLLAVKGSAEAADKKARGEIAAAQSNFEQTRTQLLQAEVKVTKLEEDLAKGTGSAAELAEAKRKLEVAEKAVTNLGTRALEYRRTLMVATYKIPVDAIRSKTMEELDLYEDALKAILGSKVGNFAIGGGGGGATLAGKTPMELARMAYNKPK